MKFSLSLYISIVLVATADTHLWIAQNTEVQKKILTTHIGV